MTIWVNFAASTVLFCWLTGKLNWICDERAVTFFVCVDVLYLYCLYSGRYGGRRRPATGGAENWSGLLVLGIPV